MRMYEVYHLDWPGTTSSSYYHTREEAEEVIANSTGGKWDDEKKCHVDLVGSDFLGIREVERDSRPCRFCGGEVQANAEKHPEVDYCRMCFYSGKVFEEGTQGIIDALIAHPRTVDDTVGVWHTGGGCFAVGAELDNGLEMLTCREACVEDPPSVEEPWGMGLTYHGDENGNGYGYLDSSLANESDEYYEITSTVGVIECLDKMLALWEKGVRSE